MLNRLFARGHASLSYAESSSIEPGLLTVFRLAVCLQIIGVLADAESATLLRDSDAWTLFTSPTVLGLALLLGYLCWPWLWQNLGRLYLPVAISLATALPFFERVLSILSNAKLQAELASVTADSITLSYKIILQLLLPLILVAWQYDFRSVLLFSLTVFLFQLGTGYRLWGPAFFAQPEQLVLRVYEVSTFLIIGYVITRMMLIQRKQQQTLNTVNTQLATANRQLAKHAATVEALATVRERNRMARDLHDTLANTLTAVAVQIEAADSAWDGAHEQVRGLLVKALGTARSGLAETRRAIKALRATPLEDLGLTLPIRTFAESIAARAGLQLMADLAEEVDLLPAVEQTVYRIAQEALTNIAKHAQAQKLNVTLRKLDAELLLLIVDDGVGFAPEQATPAGHYGLQGLYEQAQLIGAQLEIESQPQHGTTLRLRLRQLPKIQEGGAEVKEQ